MLLPSETGITFTNSVTEEQALQNEHLFNGSGVALGDVDGDGLADIYFAALDGSNVLYKNLGGWRFEDITESAGVAAPNRFSTGVTFADVDGDGDLDLLVTAMEGENAFFVNNGEGIFEERTEEAGLASSLYGTTMALADVDGDGDLDLYVANNKVKAVRDLYPPQMLEFDRVVQQVNGDYEIRPEFREHYRLTRQRNRLTRFEYAEPDKFYLNDGTGHFEEISFTSGWFMGEDGEPLTETPTDWGLAARFHDIDDDGDPDLYVCNDFESPDRLWINDGTGRFRLVDHLALRTTSNATMAMDFSDVDRDGDVDFMLLDMLDRRGRSQKTQVSSMVPQPPAIGEIENRPQIGRNTLFVNRGDGTFAEVGYFAGVEASGWSWSVLFLDVDLDGYEDVLIGSGHTHDFLDQDTQNRMQRSRRTADWRRNRLLFPKLYLRNVVFRNNGDLTFDEVGEAWGFGNEEDVSHGMATADLDGDGDLDVVINRLGFPAAVYRNESNRDRVAVRLRGLPPNTQGIGAKIFLRGGPVPEQRKEVTLGGLYTSSSDPVYTFAAASDQELTILVEWRSGKRSLIPGVVSNRLYEIDEAGAVDLEDVADPTLYERRRAGSRAPLFYDATAELGHVHAETEYDDFRRQPLLRHRLSQLGPGITWHDVDRDGDEDLLITSGKGGTLGLYRNDAGRLTRVRLRMEEAQLDLTTVLPVPSGSGGISLLVGQMNYEAVSPAAARAAAAVLRVDLGLGRGIAGTLVPRVTTAVPGAESSTGPLALADYDGDGDLDLFVGGRVLPARYPAPASSRLFLNDGGRFMSDTVNSKLLSSVGLVSSAVFSDVDQDGDPDLLLAVDWGSLKLFINESGRFSDATASHELAQFRSMWNGITTGDFDGDGLPDIVATSWGRNTKLQADAGHPLRLYYADFDANSTMDIVEARYDSQLGDLAPVRGRHHMTRGIPYVERLIPSNQEYADATVQDVLGPALAKASILEVNTFDHMLFLNRGGRFEAFPLPAHAQLAPSFYVGVADFDGDGKEDLFLTQNFYPTENETSRYAAGRGLWLRGDGTGQFELVPGVISGVKVYGDQRGAALADYNADGRVDLVISQNANVTKLYRNQGGKPGLRVRLAGPAGNPDAVGATIRLVYGERRGPAREIRAGSGYWSQDGAVQVLGMDGTPTAVWVRWPGGAESSTPVPEGASEVAIRMPL